MKYRMGGAVLFLVGLTGLSLAVWFGTLADSAVPTGEATTRLMIIYGAVSVAAIVGGAALTIAGKDI